MFIVSELMARSVRGSFASTEKISFLSPKFFQEMKDL